MLNVLLTSTIIFVSMASSNIFAEENKMEREIKRHLENIQKSGETKWSQALQQSPHKNETIEDSESKVRMVKSDS